VRWGYIIAEVIFFWLKCGCLWFAYTTAKQFATREPSSPEKVSAKKRLIFCAKCVGVIALIGFFASGNYVSNDEGEDVCVISMDYDKGAIVFIALLVPALFGAADGFDAPPEPKPRGGDDGPL
jgi:Na+/proline symporter